MFVAFANRVHGSKRAATCTLITVSMLKYTSYFVRLCRSRASNIGSLHPITDILIRKVQQEMFR